VSALPDANRNGPGSASGTAPKNFKGTATLAPATDPLDDLARHVDGTFVVVVETTGGKYRRRAFLTVAAAEKSAASALAKGHNCRVFLAELRPLFLLQAPDVQGEVAS
jgi:hypothetical protein